MTNILHALNKAGAVLTGYHFVYKSGKHGPNYINMDVLFPETCVVQAICHQLAAPFRHDGIDIVVAAATGGIPLAYGSALDLDAYFLWADKTGDGFVFERAGFADRLAGSRVLIVEDLINAADTVKKLIALTRTHGGYVVGVSAICNRGKETAESIDTPRLEVLSTVNFTAVAPESCELCTHEVPIVVNIGHGNEYRTSHPDYSGGYIKV